MDNGLLARTLSGRGFYEASKILILEIYFYIGDFEILYEFVVLWYATRVDKFLVLKYQVTWNLLAPVYEHITL